MPEFAYEALTTAGSVERGAMSVGSELELEQRLREQGQFLIRAEPRTEDDPAPAGPGAPDAAGPAGAELTDGPIPRRELLAFTEYLWGAIQAGLPILGILHDLEAQTTHKRLRRITHEVRHAMEERGQALSEALAEHPQAFPQLYVGTIAAGEATGQLDYTLKQLVDHLEWQREITLQIRKATLYPLIVLSIMALLIVVLLVFVYPRLLPIFTGFGVELPLPTRIVLAVGGFVSAYWPWLLAGLFGLVLAYQLTIRTPRGRLAIDSARLRVPILGPLIRQIEMARVVTYMALFYRTGINLLQGLGLLEQMLPNRRIAREVHEARVAITGGESISQAFARSGLFPSIVLRSMALGEATGKLDESLERARAYYAREVPASVQRMVDALQPLLIVVIGAVLAVVALSVFLPIVRIYQSVSG